MKCKNVECFNETNGKNVYCSLTCRNYYVNKYLRDYSNIGKVLSDKALKLYEENPKFCKNPNCGKKIEYDKRRNDFCNHSCSVKVTNIGLDRTKNKLSDNGYYNIVEANQKRRGPNFKEYSHCLCCGKKLNKVGRVKFCSDDCRKNDRQKHMAEFLKYKSEANFKFNLSDYPDEFDFELIKKHGWYKPVNRGNNLGGVSRDHMLSVREGFKLGVDPKIISHPANCKLMVHNENISKNKKSTITLTELLDRINKWDEKYYS